MKAPIFFEREEELQTAVLSRKVSILFQFCLVLGQELVARTSREDFAKLLDAAFDIEPPSRQLPAAEQAQETYLTALAVEGLSNFRAQVQNLV